MRISIAAAATSLALMAPSVALADSNGVHTDPNSPAARQYVLPVQQARITAGGGRGAKPALPFGTKGLGSPPAHTTSTATKPAPAASHKTHKAHKPASAKVTPGVRVPAASTLGSASPQVAGKDSAATNGTDAWLPLIGGGLLVLLLGGGGGLLLRRRLLST